MNQADPKRKPMSCYRVCTGRCRCLGYVGDASIVRRENANVGRSPTFGKASGRIMGIFDKAESEAENMAQKDPNLTQQADQSGDSQSGQDMQTTQDDMQTAQN